MLRRFRAREVSLGHALAELGLGRTRFYELYASYLAACARRRAVSWSPASSGGNHRAPLPDSVAATLRKLLTAVPSCSYSLAASEALRRHDFAIDRATVRRWALREGIAPLGPRKKAPRPVRRWQVQQIGQLPAPSGVALRAKAPPFGYLAPLGSGNTTLRPTAGSTVRTASLPSSRSSTITAA